MVLPRRGRRSVAGMGVHRSFFAGLMALGALVAGFSSMVAVAHAEGSCPNEALRSELNSGSLADCRAFEMVTPVYKEGYPLLASSYASNGEKAIVTSLGNLAGTPGEGETPLEGAVYMDSRTASGWRFSPLNAPLSQFVGQLPVAYEADSGMTLWDQHTPDQSAEKQVLYIRSTVGTYSLVGPLLPPRIAQEEPSNVIEGEEVIDRPAAATNDYTHVVLEPNNSAAYWPFDGTVGTAGSLYEYSGTVSERTGVYKEQPILVAVEGEKGSQSLIGQCGSKLGGGTVYNALSSDGESLFFTVEPVGLFGCEGTGPEVQEVYARLHGALSSTAPAVTVHVSASECTAGCEVESGKNFEGASENGEKVFFTSTQKLVEGAVDGTESGNAARPGCARIAGGMGCNLYEYDFGMPGSECQVARRCLSVVSVGAGVLGVAGISEDGSRVYYVARGALAGAGANEYGAVPVEGQPNLYVYDTVSGTTKFITTLGAGDASDWQKELQRPVEITGGEGQFVVFASSRPDVTPDDTSSQTQLFEYDALTGELVRVTQGENEYNENGNGVAEGVEALALGERIEQIGRFHDFKSLTNRLSVSGDGRTVFFESGGALSSRASSAARGCLSLYEFHSGGLISQGVVHLVSDGQDVQLVKGNFCGTQFAGMDASGANVLFNTDDPLLGSDVDGAQRDIYDARVDGGFPPVVSDQSCDGSGCEGAPSASPPVFGAPLSAGVTGNDNLTPPVPSVKRVIPKKAAVKCAKSKKLVHGKCVGSRATGRSKSKTKRARRAGFNRRSMS